ncbi:MAG: hypothetical protein IKP74_01620, partial [Clostridia bacterium]|nr:hypothetical protein [Clostridia bacterium]
MKKALNESNDLVISFLLNVKQRERAPLGALFIGSGSRLCDPAPRTTAPAVAFCACASMQLSFS